MITTEKSIAMRRFNGHALVNGIVVSGIVLGWTNSAIAQRRPIADDTLGDERSIVLLDPQGTIDRIEGGAQRGDNLFHSFREFNVDAGRSVYFADPGVDSILARVMGGVESQILGVLGVLGDANLFLINPSGIIFGSNARLDVRGSFFATTADAVQFGEQGFFSAIDPTTSPLLTVQPSAALFNQLNPAPIANNSRTPAAQNLSGVPEFGLRVPAGERLTLLGGNISMNRSGLVALGGRVEVGGLSEPGAVTLNADGMSFPIGVARSDVSLTNQSRINVVAGNGGSITVDAGNFELSDSILSAGISSNSGFVGAQAGNITLNANAIRSSGATAIANQVRVGGIGNAGDIRITTGSLSLSNGDRLDTRSLGQGNAGNVIIQAGDRVFLDRVGSAILSNVGSRSLSRPAVGDSGDIRIDTNFLSLNNDAQLQASTLGRGDAGNVIIHARDRVALSNGSTIFSTVGLPSSDGTAVGDGGDIRITTGSLSLTTGSQLNSATLAQGDAGNVIIHARDRVFLNGQNRGRLSSNIFSSVGGDGSDTIAVGDGGDIRISAGSLSLINGSQLSAITVGRGDAGNITLHVRDRIALDGENWRGLPSAISSSVGAANANTTGIGNGGTIRIATGSLSLTNSAQIRSNTFSRGNAGNIIIHAQSIFLAGTDRQGSASAISSSTRANAQGGGGALSITADSVRLADRALILSSTVNRSPGGTITLNANTFEATGGGQVNTSTNNRGRAGNIILNVSDRITRPLLCTCSRSA